MAFSLKYLSITNLVSKYGIRSSVSQFSCHFLDSTCSAIVSLSHTGKKGWLNPYTNALWRAASFRCHPTFIFKLAWEIQAITMSRLHLLWMGNIQRVHPLQLWPNKSDLEGVHLNVGLWSLTEKQAWERVLDWKWEVSGVGSDFLNIFISWCIDSSGQMQN